MAEADAVNRFCQKRPGIEDRRKSWYPLVDCGGGVIRTPGRGRTICRGCRVADDLY